jgi:hypothetical protein
MRTDRNYNGDVITGNQGNNKGNNGNYDIQGHCCKNVTTSPCKYRGSQVMASSASLFNLMTLIIHHMGITKCLKVKSISMK